MVTTVRTRTKSIGATIVVFPVATRLSSDLHIREALGIRRFIDISSIKVLGGVIPRLYFQCFPLL